MNVLCCTMCVHYEKKIKAVDVCEKLGHEHYIPCPNTAKFIAARRNPIFTISRLNAPKERTTKL